MSIQVQHRRDTRAAIMGVVPAVGELGYATDTKEVTLGDGTTPGGGWAQKKNQVEPLAVSGLTGAINNWTPAGYSLHTGALNLSATGACTITGLTGGAPGRVLKLYNTGTNPITLLGNNTGSAVQNRFNFIDLTLNSNACAHLLYDSTLSLWFCIGFFDGLSLASGGLLAANNLADVVSVPASRTNLGLGSLATQNASAAAITGGTINTTPIGSTAPSTGAFTTLTATSLTTASLNGGQLAGLRNRIINGDMAISQRYGTTIVSPLAGAGYTLDRWAISSMLTNKINVTQAVTALPLFPGVLFPTYLAVSVGATVTLAATDAYLLYQPIEGSNISDFAWGTAGAQPVTLSFIVSANLAGTYSGALSNAARSYPFSFVLAANTWAKVAITIPGDTAGTWTTDNTTGVQVRFNLGSGTNFLGLAGAWTAGNLVGTTGSVQLINTLAAAIAITGVQLELGSTATPFEKRLSGLALSLCQRYYQRYTAPSSAAIQYISYQSAGFFFETGFAIPPMRATPTASLIGTWALANCSGLTVLGGTPGSVNIYAMATVLGPVSFNAPVNGGYDLSAEL